MYSAAKFSLPPKKLPRSSSYHRWEKDEWKNLDTVLSIIYHEFGKRKTCCLLFYSILSNLGELLLLVPALSLVGVVGVVVVGGEVVVGNVAAAS